ncbi:MAG: endolytic transglycosylase MltG [Peptococcaceae bacterium]|nr:endolytic transglycosylase MltG [Peptococcaceae bacterium]
MSDYHKQDDNKQTPASDLPPFERIMQERAAAQKRVAETSDAHSQQPAEKDVWATRPMAPQRPKSESARPTTLQEAAAERAQLKAQRSQNAGAKPAPASAKVQQESQHESGHDAKHGEPKKRQEMPKAAQAEKRSQLQQPSNKRPKRRRRQFPMVAVVLLLCVAIVAVAAVSFTRAVVVPANADDTSTVEVEIPSGTPVSDMGDMLKEQGIIRSSLAFDLYVRVQGAAANLQAGVHDLSPSMTLGEVVSSLQEGAEEAGLTKITVNEGLTIDQIADIVAEKTDYSRDDFLNLMTDSDFIAQLVSQYPILNDSYNTPNVRYVLEGYLFPATYDFNDDEGLEALVTQMVDKTNEVLSEHQAAIDASSYSLQDIMSIASLVEKEGQTSEDRKLIAGVFYNRLNEGMAIQSDISVLYALGTHKEMVTYDDLETDSPYNLYLNTGLPPGPMNSPSEDAIVAALEPTASDYLYFYANIDTGEVFYTDDYNQHLAWQEEYEETGDIQG